MHLIRLISNWKLRTKLLNYIVWYFSTIIQEYFLGIFYKKRYLFPLQWVFRRGNQDRCTGNGRADRCDDLPGFKPHPHDGKLGAVSSPILYDRMRSTILSLHLSWRYFYIHAFKDSKKKKKNLIFYRIFYFDLLSKNESLSSSSVSSKS